MKRLEKLFARLIVDLNEFHLEQMDPLEFEIYSLKLFSKEFKTKLAALRNLSFEIIFKRTRHLIQSIHNSYT